MKNIGRVLGIVFMIAIGILVHTYSFSYNMNLLIILAAAFVVSVILRLWFCYLDQKDRGDLYEMECEGLRKEKKHDCEIIRQAQIVTYSWDDLAKKQQDHFESVLKPKKKSKAKKKV